MRKLSTLLRLRCGLGLPAVHHRDVDLVGAQFVPVDAHGGRRDGQLAFLERDQLVVPGVDLAHEPAPAAHLDLRGLAGLLGHDAKAAKVGRSIVLHARVVDR